MYVFSSDSGEMKQNPQICTWRDRTKIQFYPIILYMYTTFKEKENYPHFGLTMLDSWFF